MTKVTHNAYLKATPLLDYKHPSIRKLIDKKKWQDLSEKEKINQIYLFVRDDILFGYNDKDEIKASQVLDEGIGQCNTKSTLLMALLRAVGIPCRLHGFTIDKALQKGAFTGIWYWLAPQNIMHTWVEVDYNNHWYHLEGVILDKAFLTQLQHRFKSQRRNFCGYGVYTEDLLSPEIDWNENHTYIQKLGINQNFGLFDSPDDFFVEHQQDTSNLGRYIFKWLVKKSNNANLAAIREERMVDSTKQTSATIKQT